MNKDLLETQWSQIRGLLKEKFSNLTEDDIRQINGHYDALVAKLQQKYGYSREEAEERIRSWNFDRFTPNASSRDYTTNERLSTREDRIVREEGDSSILKWLLAIGIPLILLATYFLGTARNDTASTTTAPSAYTQSTLETQADRTLANSVKTSLSAQPAFDAQNIQVTARDGVVTLTGTAPTAEIRDNIVTTVQNFAGVTRVVNHIQVR